MKKLIMFLIMLIIGMACESSVPVSTTGVKKATAQITTDASGLTAEQNNIIERLKEDARPGSIKHLYVISAYSGDVILYSTVKGKVTSGGKRLTPYEVCTNVGIPVNIGGERRYTGEVLQDDGTYGSSMDYLFWWDTKGVYHQHYVTGGQIVHVSSEPIAAKKIIINLMVE